MLAVPVKDAYTPTRAYYFEGHYWLEIPYSVDNPTTESDWDVVRRIGNAMYYEGRVYGRTGFDSDRMVVYFSTRQNVAMKA